MKISILLLAALLSHVGFTFYNNYTEYKKLDNCAEYYDVYKCVFVAVPKELQE